MNHEEALRQYAKQGDLDGVLSVIDRVSDIDAQDDMGVTALVLASSSHNLALVRLLVERGADVMHKNKYGRSPFSAAIATDYVIASYLLDQGIDINFKYSDEHMTALHLAAVGEYLDRIEFLLERGANINATTLDGYTPLMYAIGSSEPAVTAPAAARLLIERGADVSIVNELGEDALYMTTYYHPEYPDEELVALIRAAMER